MTNPIPAGSVDEERYVQQIITQTFIDSDPSTVTLIPRVRTVTAGGGITMADGQARPPQVFKLILVSAATAGAAVELHTDDSSERRHDFILFGLVDALIEIGDHWTDSAGEEWEVTSILPADGYATRANVASYGRHPDAPLY